MQRFGHKIDIQAPDEGTLPYVAADALDDPLRDPGIVGVLVRVKVGQPDKDGSLPIGALERWKLLDARVESPGGLADSRRLEHRLDAHRPARGCVEDEPRAHRRGD